MYIGIDIGTSGVKAVIVDDADAVLAEATAPLQVSRPRPLWSEQDPRDWWAATERVLDSFADAHPHLMGKVRSIGLSGQMLGVAPIDAAGEPLRPALLWSDGRAAGEGAELERLLPDFAAVTGARAMPGFSAPKLRWLAEHEPNHLDEARWVLLPKDYVRLRLSGEAASDLADSSATLLMDTPQAAWWPDALDACGVSASQLPRLVRSGEVAGTLRDEHAARWHLPRATPIVGGAGDNMCGGVGAGVVRAGMAVISLGTSGVYFLANDHFAPSLAGGMHTHRHAVEGLFCQNACTLSSAAALDWVARIVGADDVGALIAEVEAAKLRPDQTPVFTPYLAGERTPHDDPSLTGAFSGLTFATTRLDLVQGVLEGVALAIADCHGALLSTGAVIGDVTLIGGGARSTLWGTLIASAIGLPLAISPMAAVGPALGAARLARQGVGGPLLAPAIAASSPRRIEPRQDWTEQLAAKRRAYAGHMALAPG